MQQLEENAPAESARGAAAVIVRGRVQRTGQVVNLNADYYYLAQVIQQLKAEVGAPALDPIIEAALRLGCMGAHSWLGDEL